MTPQHLSLMTWNIHKGFGVGAVKFLLPEMREALMGLNPDFVFLQEVQGEHHRRQKRVSDWPDEPQVVYMAQDIWPHYLYSQNATYQSGHHGNAILSKYPFSSHESINLSNINRASRGIIHSQLDFGTVRIHLLCVHLGLFKGERRLQSEILMQRIDDMVPLHEPLIMAGDFNDWRTVLSQSFEDRLNIREVFLHNNGTHARSFPAYRPALCVDRIYIRGLTIEEVCCLEGKPWRTLSDHLPLYARLGINQ